MTEAEFLAQYMLPDDERKRLLIGNALLGLGSGLMQAKRGGELTNAGLGLFAGAQQGQNAIADAQRGQVDKFKLKQMWQEGQDKKAQQAAQAALSQRLTEAGNPTSGMPSLAPTNENAANIPKSYEVAMRQWQIATDAGDLRRAEEYRKAAEFLRVKYGLTPQTLMRDGKPVVAQMSEYGDIKEATGYAPKPDYQKVDTGKQTLFYDPLTQQQGGSFAMQTTPNADQSAALQRAQMAQSERHFNLNREDAALNRTADAIKPQPLHADERKNLQELTATKENISMLRQSFKPTYAGRGAAGNFDVATASTLGSWASKDAQDLANWWADYEKMVNLPERFAVFGASLTQGEKEAWNSARRVKPGADPKAVENALKVMETIADKRLGGLRESLVADKRQPAAIDAIVNRSGSQPAKMVVRRGTEKATGRKVVQYSDGTTEYE